MRRQRPQLQADEPAADEQVPGHGLRGARATAPKPPSRRRRRRRPVNYYARATLAPLDASAIIFRGHELALAQVALRRPTDGRLSSPPPAMARGRSSPGTSAARTPSGVDRRDGGLEGGDCLLNDGGEAPAARSTPRASGVGDGHRGVAASDCARNEASAAWIGATIILAPRGSSAAAAPQWWRLLWRGFRAIAILCASASAAAASFTRARRAQPQPHECPQGARRVARSSQAAASGPPQCARLTVRRGGAVARAPARRRRQCSAGAGAGGGSNWRARGAAAARARRAAAPRRRRRLHPATHSGVQRARRQLRRVLGRRAGGTRPRSRWATAVAQPSRPSRRA